MMKFNKRYGALLLMSILVLVLAAGCGVSKQIGNESLGSGSGSNNSNGSNAGQTNTPEPTPSASNELELLGPDKHPVVTIEMSNDKIIKVELYPEVAPNTVNNFISLVQDGFYDGLIFHRVMPGFMIQGGDPQGNGGGGPGYTIAGEFSKNGFTNQLKHTRGVISMARAEDPDSAGSQFFIMHADSPHLDNQYASFGMVIEGLDVVDEIVSQPTVGTMPKDPLAMRKVTVDTLDMTFEEPKKME